MGSVPSFMLYKTCMESMHDPCKSTSIYRVPCNSSAACLILHLSSAVVRAICAVYQDGRACCYLLCARQKRAHTHTRTYAPIHADSHTMSFGDFLCPQCKNAEQLNSGKKIWRERNRECDVEFIKRVCTLECRDIEDLAPKLNGFTGNIKIIS